MHAVHRTDNPRCRFSDAIKEAIVTGVNPMEIAVSLEEKLAAVRESAAKRIPADRLAIMHNATERLRRSGILDRVIKPGARAPDFTLNDQNGAAVTLSAKLATGPVLMSVFRGFW